MESKNWLTGLFAVVVVVLLLFVAFKDTPEVPTADEIAAKVVIPEITVPTAAEIVAAMPQETAVEGEEAVTLDEIKGLITEEKDWKYEARDLVYDDIRDNDLEEFLNDNGFDVDDDEDIISWRVKDWDVDNIDVDEQNADVWLELRVRFFEDGDEDDKTTEKIFVEAVVEEGEVDDINFYF